MESVAVKAHSVIVCLCRKQADPTGKWTFMFEKQNVGLSQ